jgi:UDP-N-acetylmuramate--alanine ligase
MSIKNTHFSNEEIENFFNKAKKIFFIGIGGVSMSSLAVYCHFLGKEIFGYDHQRSESTCRIESFAHIKYCSTPDSVCGVDLVIYSNAIDEENFEYKQAKKLKIPTLSRANFLSYVLSRYKASIGIAGSHGKSTTTALLAKIFDYAHLNPTVFCGARMRGYDSAFLWGQNDFILAEACEYMDSFLCLSPSTCGITNIEYDHPDYFKNEEEYLDSFKEFISKSERVVLGIDTPLGKRAYNELDCKGKIITFSQIDKEADYFAKEKGDGFILYRGKEIVLASPLNFKGAHYVENATCASIIALENGISSATISKALEESYGVFRRLEFIKKSDTGMDIFEDYAHHPTEIKATLSSLLKMGYKRIACIFQPHTFSRTQHLYSSFLGAFSLAYKSYIIPTYRARNENEYEVDERKLACECGAEFLENYEDLKEIISSREYDCLVLMGAGDIGKLKKYL